MKTKIRIVLSLILVGIIWYRVDWSVGLFALLVLAREEYGFYSGIYHHHSK